MELSETPGIIQKDEEFATESSIIRFIVFDKMGRGREEGGGRKGEVLWTGRVK